MVTNETIFNIWIHFNKSDVIISFSGKHDSEFFKDQISIYEPANSWNELYNSYFPFKSLGRYTLTNNKGSTPVISFVRSLPMTEVKPYATLIIDIREETFKNMISAVSGDNPTFVYVIDQAGNIITSYKTDNIEGMDEIVLSSLFDNSHYFNGLNEEYFFDNKIMEQEYTIAVTSSTVNGWKYVSVIPTSFIASKANFIRKITFFFMLFSFFVGLALVYIMARLIYRPIQKIISYIRIIENPQLLNKEVYDELSFINTFIKFVYKENKELKKFLDDSTAKIQKIFLSDLLEGNIAYKQFHEVVEAFNLDIPFELFQVAVFSIDNIPEYTQVYEDKLDEIIKEECNKIEKQTLEKFKIDIIKKNQRTIVCLFNISKHYDCLEDVFDFLKSIKTCLKNDYGILSTVGVGKLYDNIEGIPTSYREALFALKFKVVQGQNSIIHIDEVDGIPEYIFEYPLDKEKQIINMTKSGDYMLVRESIEEIIAKNLSKEESTPEMINNLFNALAGTAIRTVYEIQSSTDEIFEDNFNIYNSLDNEETIEGKKDIIFFIFEKITTYVSTKKQSQNQKVYEQIINYVNKNGSVNLV